MNEEYPLISVVVPVYNQEKFIAETLESVINQTYTNLQILVSDDGSSDCSYDVIKEYALKDERIEILHNNNNVGICGNFNRLFDNVRGEYVAFFSGDDVMMPDKLRKQYELLKDNPAVVVVHHNAWLIDGESNKKSLHQKNQLPLNNPLDWALKTNWFHAKRIAPLLPTSCLARTDYYLKARYDNRFKYKHELLFTIEDYHANPNGKWVYLKEPLIFYRMHESNFTNNPAFTNYLNAEKFKLADIALDKCPALKKRIKYYKLFMLFETIIFKWYNQEQKEIDVKQEYKNEANLVLRLILGIAVFLKNINLYGVISHLLHYTIYRPLFYIKYNNYIR